MSLWFVMRANEQPVGSLQIRRQQDLDLTDPTAIADEVCTYEVRVDGKLAGNVAHRYGDGAWELLRKAMVVVP